MAGYVRKHVGRIYEGGKSAGEALTNGIFVENTADGVKKITASKDTKLKVSEKTSLWGLKALVLQVTDSGANEIYFLVNEWEIDDNTAYDETTYSMALAKPLRMKRLIEGEEIIMSVSDAVYAGALEKDVLWPASGGSIIQAPLAPVITTNLSATKSVATDAELSLAVVAAATTDEGTLSYQWYKGTSAITGATDATYTEATAAAGDAGVYTCKITNTLNTLTRVTTSAACTVTVTA